jgi:nucleotide-binding universal stress UspA family protein
MAASVRLPSAAGGAILAGMIEVIAVGTDGSETADKALELAIDLAARHEAELVVLSAYNSNPSALASAAIASAWVAPAPLGPEWNPQEAERVDGLLANAKHRAEQRGIACRTAAGEGDPAEVLVELAESHGADLLVIGNRGMQRRVLGSVPNTITHKARCSVFVVKTT